jgi:hypothetical protein
MLTALGVITIAEQLAGFAARASYEALSEEARDQALVALTP